METTFRSRFRLRFFTYTYNTRLWVAGPYSELTMLTASTMPQAGFDPPAQSDTSYEADTLPPSHHGWIVTGVIWKDNLLTRTALSLLSKQWQNCSCLSWILIYANWFGVFCIVRFRLDLKEIYFKVKKIR